VDRAPPVLRGRWILRSKRRRERKERADVGIRPYGVKRRIGRKKTLPKPAEAGSSLGRLEPPERRNLGGQSASSLTREVDFAKRKTEGENSAGGCGHPPLRSKAQNWEKKDDPLGSPLSHFVTALPKGEPRVLAGGGRKRTLPQPAEAGSSLAEGADWVGELG